MVWRSRRVAWLLAGVLPALAESASDAGARADRLRADVARLASAEWEGRRAGQEGAREAAAWLESRFRGLGLKPLLPEGRYQQEFSFLDGAELGTNNRLEVGGRVYEAGRDFRPLAFSAPAGFSGEVTFAGYGIDAPHRNREDYTGLEVEGRAVLVLRYAPHWGGLDSPWQAQAALQEKARVARRHGASALLVVTGPRSRGAGDALVPFRTDAALSDAGIPVLSIRRSVAQDMLYGSGIELDALQERADEGDRSGRPLAVPIQLLADLRPLRARTSNVVAALPGRVDETLVVGAHYDHLGLGGAGSLDSSGRPEIHHGADDNASGTAAMLELARALAAREHPLRRRVVFVAFGAEELGLLGSVHFVENPPLDLASVVAMINLDMIGRLRGSGLLLQGLDTSPAWAPLIEAANAEAGLRIRPLNGGAGPSDHASFFAMRVPALFFFTGLHGDYHLPSDTSDRVDATGIARILSLVEPLALSVADSSDPLPFHDPAREPAEAVAH